jgi:uncharacterized protein (DUF1330 family)
MTIPMFTDEFNPENVRQIWHEGEWYISVIDLIAEAMTSDHKRAKSYWSTLKQRLSKEGNETVTNCEQMKMLAPDGKMRLTDVITVEQSLRLIQSIPSPKVEPMKLWLANLGAQHLEDREAQVHAFLEKTGGHFRRQGKSDSWIEARIQGMITRKEFVESLKAAVINAPPSMYAQATETLYRGLWERTTAQLRGELLLNERQNPRDHFGEYALIYTRLAEKICTDKLDEHEYVAFSMALDIVWLVSKAISEQADATARLLGRDLVTERPLVDYRERPQLP